MGCGSSKLKSLPEGTSDEAFDKTVSTDRSRKKQLRESGGKKTDSRSKAPKYRTKVDSRVIAKYDIKALLGKGSFSDVLRVENRLTKQPFAIKILRLRGPDSRELFEAELDVLRHIQHPLVIKLAEVFEAKDHVYLIMELATGGELYDRIKSKGHYQEKEAVRVLQMVLDGVGYLHENGITHRDLKPENLLFYHPGQDSKILITDFGFAASKLKSEGSLYTTFCGTPEYIAPEVLSKKPYTNAVDMWAIGVIAFVMLSGHLPFPSDTTAKLFTQIVTADFSFTREVWNTVSDDAKDFISRLLVVDYNKRLVAKDAVKISWITSVTPLPVLLKSSTFSQNYSKYASQMRGPSRSHRSLRSNKVYQTRRRTSSSAVSDSQFSQSTGRMSQAQQRYLEVSGKLLAHNHVINGGLHVPANGVGADRQRSRHVVSHELSIDMGGSRPFGLESVTDVSDPQAPTGGSRNAYASSAATEDSNSIAIPSVDISHSVLDPIRPTHVDRNAADTISTVSSATGRDEAAQQLVNSFRGNGLVNGGLELEPGTGDRPPDSHLDARKIAHLDALFSPHKKGGVNHTRLGGPFKERVGGWLEEQTLYDAQLPRLTMPGTTPHAAGLTNGLANSFGPHVKPLSLPPLDLHVARPSLAVPPAVELEMIEHRGNEDGPASGTVSSSRTFLTANHTGMTHTAVNWQDYGSNSNSQSGFNNSARSTLQLLQSTDSQSIS